jgi:hypothetical protein
MAIGATGSAIGFNELFSTTLQKLQSELVDQTVTAHPSLELFKEVISAGQGPNYNQPVRGALLGKTAVSDDLGTFSTAVDGEIAGIATYNFSNPIVTPTSLAWRQIALNEGSNKVIDIVRAHLEAAIDDHTIAIAEALYGGGVAGGEFNSMLDIVDDTAALGGIDPTVVGKEWWKSTVQAPVAGTDIRLALRDLNDAIVDASNKQPDVILMGKDAYAAYESSLDDAVRYMALGTGDTRFQSLQFRGLEVRRDGINAPDDAVFMLNKKTLVAQYLDGHFMKANPSQVIPGTLTEVTPLSTMLFFGTSERRANGRLTYTP